MKRTIELSAKEVAEAILFWLCHVKDEHFDEEAAKVQCQSAIVEEEEKQL